MLVFVLFPVFPDQHLETTTDTTGVSIAAIMKEGTSTILGRHMTKHAFHWTILTGSTTPSIPPGRPTHPCNSGVII